MRNLLRSLRQIRLAKCRSVFFGVVLAISTFGQTQAANFFEKNFYLSGPRYDGRMGQCDQALWYIAKQFAEKESTFWNSGLAITGFADVQEVAFRPWSRGATETIPRRFCTASALLNDGGQPHQVHYSVIEDGGLASIGSGVEWCVTGLDRNWAYNPACKAAQP